MKIEIMSVKHPFGGETIEGEVLLPGTIIEVGDMFSCTDGSWRVEEEILLEGYVPDIDEDLRSVIWVRPHKAKISPQMLLLFAFCRLCYCVAAGSR